MAQAMKFDGEGFLSESACMATVDTGGDGGDSDEGDGDGDSLCKFDEFFFLF